MVKISLFFMVCKDMDSELDLDDDEDEGLDKFLNSLDMLVGGFDYQKRLTAVLSLSSLLRPVPVY